jgi:predicted AAA+ superfamily ATPase
MYNRILTIKLPPRQSAFLWGGRKTGKSTYLKQHFPQAIYYDLLKSDIYFDLVRYPFKFREQILALIKTGKLINPIIIDEVQKIPKLLDEVHWLIENTEAQFILCGSSARKLRQGGVNLLGGRAWGFSFYPLVYPEISDFELLTIFNRGAIPSHYLSQNYSRSLKAYVEDYLKLEIQSEGLVRNLPAFSKFLDSIGFSNGEMVVYANIARDCGVDAKTVKEYYQILIDTLLGYYVTPFNKSRNRKAISAAPKFYLFDIGVANYIARNKITELKGAIAGKSIEHYILMELMAYRGIQDLDFQINYWRTKTKLEVSFVLSNHQEILAAIEVKISSSISNKDLRGLAAFANEYPVKQLCVVSLESRARVVKLPNGNADILILPYQDFLDKLWAGFFVK